MTTTYDPHHANYLDEADVRNELTRVFDLCQECRRCVTLCTSFPTLFELIAGVDGDGAGGLTPAEQDRVVDECVQCKLCHVACPYTPGVHDWAIDFPRLMLRADAMRHATGQVPLRAKVSNQMRGRTDLVGHVGTALARVAGGSSVRLLAPFTRQRFSTWFDKRASAARRSSAGADPLRPSHVPSQGAVTVYPTCLVEYQEPRIGHDLVKVYERNGVECAITAAGCCGAPWLHAGNVEQFTKVAGENVERLADDVRAGTDIVVPQPTCSYVLKHDYVHYVGGPDAELVAAHTFDAAEYLMKMHTGDDTRLDTEFPGDVPETVTYHSPCHLRAQGIGVTSRDLIALTGAEVTVVEQCSGLGTRGLRSGNHDISIPLATELGDQITSAGGDVVAGDCHLANTVITEHTGRDPMHPIQLIARAYGITQE
jgi:glycerol-3-phosphate dehydrogenase subunit C